MSLANFVFMELFLLLQTGVNYFILDLGVESFVLFPPTAFVSIDREVKWRIAVENF